MGKPRQGKTVKKHRSIRLEDPILYGIQARFGSLSEFIDAMITKENIEPQDSPPPKPPKPPKSVD